MLRKYARFQLLILDDFGISPMSMDDAVNLFEIIEDRTLVSSTIIASQLPVAHWHDYLNHNTIADAILDRVVHSSHRIELEGGSMRRLKSTIQNKGETKNIRTLCYTFILENFPVSLYGYSPARVYGYSGVSSCMIQSFKDDK